MTKRILCLLLAALTLTVFCACGKDPSADSEADSGSAASTEVSEESEEPFVESERVKAIKQMLNGGEIDRTLKAKNLFAGKSYTYNAEPTESYSDEGNKKLTDGTTRDLFDKWCWVAFKGVPALAIVFDLGTAPHNLAEVEVGTLSQIDYGIYLPTSGRLSVSDDGKNWVDLVTVQPPADADESSKFVFRFALPKATTAQYVRILFTPNSSGFLFLDEVAGYEYCENGYIDVQNGENAGTSISNPDFYGYSLSRETLTPVSASDADYDTYQNLALLDGANVQIAHFDPMDASVCQNNTPKEKISMLIDGNFASKPTYADSAFVKFVRGCGRHVVIDLGNEMAVDRVTGEFLNEVSVGVGAPPALMVEVSHDGETWTTAWADFTGIYGDRTKIVNYRMDAKFKSAFLCRYVRVSFQTVPLNEITSSVYASEFEVWGKKNTEGAVEAQYDESYSNGRYPTVEEAGCSNILFGGLTSSDPSIGSLSLQQAKELVGYLDEDGKIKDSFMDSFCFCGMASMRGDDNKQTVENLLKCIFAENANLAAVNAAKGEVNAALGVNEKIGVWISLICPNASDVCPDIDGDGKNEDMNVVEDRLDFLKWEIETILKEYAKHDNPNCELLGFYWLDECIDREEDDKDALTIREINKYIHAKGLRSFWCPYYSAYGIWRWKEVGFDFACYQPNYMFYATEPTRLRAASTIAKINGLCMEIEIEDAGSAGSCALFRQYLREGYDSGVMNSVKMYYHGSIGGVLTKARTMTLPHSKALYNDAYLYAKCRLDDSYNVVSSASFDVFTNLTAEVKTGKRITLNIADPEKTDVTAFQVRLIQSPVFGTIRLNNNGELTYNAMKGYDGIDTVLIEISDGAGNRKVITLVIDLLK